MIDKKVLQIHFSRNAENYDIYANVQKKMAKELLKAVSFSETPRDILDIGCGTGYLTEQLLGRYPEAKITAVDIAPGMIEYAGRKFKSKDITFLCADIETEHLDQRYDLIVSNATFQWFNHMEATMVKLGAMLKDNGILAFSTFGCKTFQELHQSYETARNKLQLGNASLPGQRFFSRDELLSICKRNLSDTGLAAYEISSHEKLEYEYFDTVRGFLESVKKIGANNSNTDRKNNPALTREMIRTYETTFKENEKVRATYHCVFLTVKNKKANDGKL